MDDGIGPAIVERLERLGLDGVRTSCGYQLDVEDSADIAASSLTVLVDAARTGPEPFALSEVTPREEASFSTHSQSPEGLLHLTRSCFNPTARAWLLAVRGYEFDAFGEGLSAQAEANLKAALVFLEEIIAGRKRGFESALAAAERHRLNPEHCEDRSC